MGISFTTEDTESHRALGNLAVYSSSISILLLLGGGVPEGGGGRKKRIPLKDYFCIVLSTTPPFGHPSSQEEGNGVTLQISSRRTVLVNLSPRILVNLI